jgi:hypothetical protein
VLLYICTSVYKAMIPFSWYHHSDKRCGPFVLLYSTVQLTPWFVYSIVCTDHHMFIKVIFISEYCNGQGFTIAFISLSYKIQFCFYFTFIFLWQILGCFLYPTSTKIILILLYRLDNAFNQNIWYVSMLWYLWCNYFCNMWSYEI